MMREEGGRGRQGDSDPVDDDECSRLFWDCGRSGEAEESVIGSDDETSCARRSKFCGSPFELANVG